MLNYTNYQTFFQLLTKSSNILILNSKPDGDSIGASLALNKLLKKLNKKAMSISPSPIPEYLNFLYKKDDIKVAELTRENLNDYDLIILVDFDDIKRLTKGERININPKAKFICIDHHTASRGVGLDLKLTDPLAESTCGIITDIFIEYKQENSKDLFDKEIAYLLYAGIVSDTDYFGYANATQETFERAAFLLQYDFNVTEIILKFRESLSTKAFKFIQRNIGRIILNEEKKYAYLKIKKSDLSEEDNLAVVNEASNFLNRALIRIIDGVNFSFILREINDQKCSLSMRLHNNGNNIDLSKIAAKFGGGGHIQAAGGQIDMNVDEFEKEIINYLNTLL